MYFMYQGHAEEGKIERKVIENPCLHTWRLHNFSVQSVPAFNHPHNKKSVFLSSSGISYF